MRFGAFGERTVEQLMQGLGEPKLSLFKELRKGLLSLGLNEKVDYNPYEVEAMPIYSLSSGDELLRTSLKFSFSVSIILDPSSAARMVESGHFVAVGDEKVEELVDEKGFKVLKFPIDSSDDVRKVVKLAEIRLVAAKI